MQAVRVLPFLFLFCGSIALFDQVANEHLSDLRKMRWTFVESIRETRSRLVSNSWRLAEDPVIQQNLASNNFNTVGQLLQNYMPSGEVTQLEVLDAECNLLTRLPANSKPLGGDCAPDTSKKPTLSWRQNAEGVPVLSFALSRVVNGRNIVILSQVLLGSDWLSLYPSLMGLTQKHQVRLFDPSRRGLLWNDASNAGNDPMVSMRLDGWFFRSIPDLTQYSLASVQTPFWLAYGVLGFLIVLSIMQAGVSARRDSDSREAVEKWIHAQKEFMDRSTPEKSDQPRTWLELTDCLKLMLTRSREQWSQHVKLLQDRKHQTSLEQHDRDRQILSLQEKIAGMADLASLKEQLQHSTGSVLKQMGHIRELCENLYDVTTNGITKQSKEVHAFYARWRDGIADESHRERGARKFFRTLSETPGSSPHTTQLDDQLTELGNLASSVIDQSLHVAMLARQALVDSEGVAQVAGLWHGLSSQSAPEPTSDWVGAMGLAQQMVTADERYQTLSFERLPSMNNCEEMYPPKAKGALISGFFHLYLGLLSGSADKGTMTMPIIVRQKQIKDRGTIMLSLPHTPQDIASATISRDQSYHMELARAIFAPLGIRTAFLPPNASGVPVAMTWPLPGKDIEVASSQEQVQSL